MIIPALTGRGRDGYRSLDRKTLTGFDGTAVAEVTITPSLLVHDIARRPTTTLRALPIERLMEIFRQAAGIFSTGQPDGLAPEAYVRNASLTSGMPLSIMRRQTLGLFSDALHAMDRYLEPQSPGGLPVFDSNTYSAGGISIGLVPRGRNVGFVMPGNHPSTHFIWLGALAMKFPVVLRPSEDDVFTPNRLALALMEAGLPEDAIACVPGPHELVDAIVQACSLSVLFGMQHLADRYAANRNVKVYGPGRSKVVVLPNAGFAPTVEMICRMVMDDAGRGCVNASAVIVEGDATDMACAVAGALERIPVVSPLTEAAQLGALRSIGEAGSYNSLIDSGLLEGGRELTPGRSERVATLDGAAIMRPTVLQVPSPEHPLFGLELPFPFVVFAPARSREETLSAARNSLVVAIAGNDEVLTRELFLDPSIDKVYAGGELSTEFDVREPHEGFLLDFLYQKKALRASQSGQGIARGARLGVR